MWIGSDEGRGRRRAGDEPERVETNLLMSVGRAGIGWVEGGGRADLLVLIKDLFRSKTISCFCCGRRFRRIEADRRSRLARNLTIFCPRKRKNRKVKGKKIRELVPRVLLVPTTSC